MKKNYLLIVAVSASLLSCNYDDNIINSSALNYERQSKGDLNIDFIIYSDIMRSFKYDSNLNSIENFKLFEFHINNYMPFYYNDHYDFTLINWEEVNYLMDDEKVIIENLNYSERFKSLLYEIAQGNYENIDEVDKYERNILNTLISISKENDNDPPANSSSDPLRDRLRRTIAFAYGYQYNLSTAILYSYVTYL